MDKDWEEFNKNNDAEARVEQFMQEQQEKQNLSQRLSQKFD